MKDFSQTDLFAMFIFVIALQVLTGYLLILLTAQIPKPLSKLLQSMAKMNHIQIEQKNVYQMKRNNYICIGICLILTIISAALSMLTLPKCHQDNVFLRVCLMNY